MIPKMKYPSGVVLLVLLVFMPGTYMYSQEVPHSVNNTGVYEFLDELASMKLIEINSAVKPYSRMYIASRLREADSRRELLNRRQQKELDFYLTDFSKEIKETGRNGLSMLWHNGLKTNPARGTITRLRRDLFYYKDSLFSLTVNPILGGELFSSSGGRATYIRNGAEARAYIGKWGFFASLRDNHEKPLLGRPEYLTKREGGHIKNSTDWSDMQGGITYAWNWGSAGLVKDRQQWGNNYNGANIFGGNNPTFVQLRLNINPVKWFNFNYFHGWLNSMVVDSSRSYWQSSSYGTSYHKVYHKKYVAANMFTFTPFRNLNISAGNSIVYSDRKFNAAYLIPLFFYKSVDHSLTSGIDNMNSQMFLDISSRQIRKLHLYATLFVDELSVSRFTRDDEWNFFSWKTGFRVSNFPLQNVAVTTEFTYTYPLAFRHYLPVVTFETADFNLGHYLKDNSREWYLALNYRPVRALDISLSFTDAVRGPDYTELGGRRVGNPPLASVEWHMTTVGLRAAYQVINDLYAWGSVSKSNIRGDERWTAKYFHGNRNIANFGVTMGF
jgi:hypothetical protein